MSVAIWLRQAYYHDPDGPLRNDVFTTADTVELVVNSHPMLEGPLELVLWEFDPGVTDPRPEDVLARVRGRLIQNPESGAAFEPEAGATPKIPKGSPHFRLHSVGLPDADFDVPLKTDANDQLELGAAAGSTGLVYKVMVRLEQNGRKVCESREWVLIRDFRNFFQDGRPVVTFILGNDEKDDFYKAAAEYWKQHSDIVVINGTTVEGMLRFLRGEREYEGSTLQRGWIFGPWGHINVVAHGFFSAWNVALVEREESPFRHPESTPWHVAEDIEDAMKDFPQRLMAPPAKMLDARSTIAILGCLVGLDEALAQAIFRLFGARAPLAACKKLQSYSFAKGQTTQNLRDLFFFLYVPKKGATPDDFWGTEKRRAATRFANKYDHNDDIVRWLPLVNRDLSSDKHITANVRRTFYLRINYASNHPQALAAIDFWSTPKPGFQTLDREGLFLTDLLKNSVGPNNQSFDTFDSERDSHRQVILEGATRDVFIDGEAPELSPGHVRFAVDAFCFLIIPPYNKPYSLDNAEQFLWIRP